MGVVFTIRLDNVQPGGHQWTSPSVSSSVCSLAVLFVWFVEENGIEEKIHCFKKITDLAIKFYLSL